MHKSIYTCAVCGESEVGKYPYCKCERRFDKDQKSKLEKLKELNLLGAIKDSGITSENLEDHIYGK